MKTTSKILIILLVLSVSFGSCKKDAAEGMLPIDNPTEEPVTGDGEFPVEVPYTDFSFYGKQCLWNYESFPMDENNTVIVYNADELKPYLRAQDIDFVDVDFSKQSVLLAHCYVKPGGILDVTKEIHLISENNYDFNVSITVNTVSLLLQRHIVAIVTNKLNSDSNIKLNVTTILDENQEQNFSEMELGTYFIAYPVGLDMKLKFIDREKVAVIKEGSEEGEFRYTVDGYWLHIENFCPYIYFRIINNRQFETDWFEMGTHDEWYKPHFFFEKEY